MNDVCPLLSPSIVVPEIPAVAFSWLFTYLLNPAALAIAAINLAVAVPLTNIVRLLQAVFTQPFLLLFGSWRKGYGQVFESLSKRPIDLALVRIIDAERGKVVATRVTDSYGRFLVLVPPGRYRLSVKKQGYEFPSRLLAGERFDPNVGAIYTGGTVLHKAQGPLEVNVPIDGEEDRVSVSQALRRQFRRTASFVFAYSGLVLGAIGVIVAWNWQSWLVFGVHIILFLMFMRLTYRPFGRPWGRVTDIRTREPLPRSVVRILDTKFNRVLETVVTNRRGQYSFIVGSNTYRLFADRPRYQSYRGDPFDVKKRYDTVKRRIGMRPGEAPVPPQNPSTL